MCLFVPIPCYVQFCSKNANIHYLYQVFLLLSIADWMVHCLWRIGRDPDTCSIPYLTALGDLLGTAFLALCFHLLYIVVEKGSDVGD